MAEAWGTLGPTIEVVMATAVANWTAALPLVLERAGYREEAYFSISQAPSEDDDGRIVGMVAVCSEVTDRVVGERRLRLLRDLSTGAAAPRGVAATCYELVAAIADHPLDVPFTLLYLREPGGQLALRGATGLPEGGPFSPLVFLPEEGDAPWPLVGAASGDTVLVEDVARQTTLPGGPWGEPTRVALAIPICPSGRASRIGVLVVGVISNHALDGADGGFTSCSSGKSRSRSEIGGPRGGAGAGGGARGVEPGEDDLLVERQPRAPHPADADARLDRGGSGRRRAAASPG